MTVFQETKPVKKIFFTFGQSNSQSANNGPIVPGVDDPVDHFWQMTRGLLYDAGKPNMSFTPARNPMQHHLSVPNSVGFSTRFGKRLLADLPAGSDVLCIPCGFGGSSFLPQKDWQGGHYTWNVDFIPGQYHPTLNPNPNPNDCNLMFDCCKRINEARKQWPDAEVVCGLFHQGESDVNNPDYQQQLMKGLNYLRTAVGLPHLIILIGSLLYPWRMSVPEPARNTTTERINNIHKAVPMCISAQRKGYYPFLQYCCFDHIVETYTGDGMQVHFSRNSQHEMGEVYYKAFETQYSLLMTEYAKYRASLNGVRSLDEDEDFNKQAIPKEIELQLSFSTDSKKEEEEKEKYKQVLSWNQDTREMKVEWTPL